MRENERERHDIRKEEKKERISRKATVLGNRDCLFEKFSMRLRTSMNQLALFSNLTKRSLITCNNLQRQFCNYTNDKHAKIFTSTVLVCVRARVFISIYPVVRYTPIPGTCCSLRYTIKDIMRYTETFSFTIPNRFRHDQFRITFS